MANQHCPPYYLARPAPYIVRFAGPFSTYHDAVIAQMVANSSWRKAEILDGEQFKVRTLIVGDDPGKFIQ